MADRFEWHDKVRALCHRAQVPVDVCDCGYVGDWQQRWWTELQRCTTFGEFTEPGRPYRLHSRCAECRAGGPGHDRIAGWEDRCPRCGDVERFRWDGTLVSATRNPDGPGFFLAEIRPGVMQDGDR